MPEIAGVKDCPYKSPVALETLEVFHVICEISPTKPDEKMCKGASGLVVPIPTLPFTARVAVPGLVYPIATAPPQPLFGITIKFPEREAIALELLIPVTENCAAAVDCPPIIKSSVELFGIIAPFNSLNGPLAFPQTPQAAVVPPNKH